MKKTKIITAAVGLCVAASMMAGCNSQGGSTGGGESAAATRIEGGQTQITVESQNSVDPYEGEYGFIFNGYKIVPGMTWNDAKAVLGDDYDQMLRADCASNEMGNIYWYEGYNFEINSLQKAGSDVEIIEFIDVSDPLIDCGGFHIGDNINDVKALLGTPDSDLDMAGVEYVGTDTKLVISPDETGKIIFVKFGLAKVG